MVKALNRTDPSGLSVQNMLQGSGGTGTYHGWLSVHVPLAATSTANGATNWVNPETGTVLARAVLYFTTAGTGTFDMGRSSDGTGNSSDMIDGGTMTVGAHYAGTVLGTVDASSTIGGVNRVMFLVGPGGTGTNNSINVTHNDTTTSTAIGGLLIEYYPIGR
jgi:hypothetical protein